MAEYEREVTELRTQLRFLEEETQLLKRRQPESPRHVKLIEDKLAETRAQLAQALAQNERLASTLRETKEQIVALKEEVEKLAAPPSGFGTYLTTNEDGTVDIMAGGRKLRVNCHPEIDPKSLVKGQEVMLNEAMNIIAARTFEVQGEVVRLKEMLD